MKVYIFGNQDHPQDNYALHVVGELKASEEIPTNEKAIYDNIEFVFIKPNENLPFTDGENVILMDIIQGVNVVRVVESEDLDRLKLSPRTSVHDFDLGFQLKYLKKLGKLGNVKIIGLPMEAEINLAVLHKILLQMKNA